MIDKVINQDLSAFLHQKHESALKFNLRYENGIKILKEGKRITIGYVDNRMNL